jgi:transcriptional regulator with XRE-family HTH domain
MSGAWWEYVSRVSGDAPKQEIAAAAGIDPSQVSRWSNGQNPNAKQVVHLARSYDRPPVEALIAAGYLDEDEASGVVELAVSVRDMSIEELASEIGRFVAELRQRATSTTPSSSRGPT